MIGGDVFPVTDPVLKDSANAVITTDPRADPTMESTIPVPSVENSIESEKAAEHLTFEETGPITSMPDRAIALTTPVDKGKIKKPNEFIKGIPKLSRQILKERPDANKLRPGQESIQPRGCLFPSRLPPAAGTTKPTPSILPTSTRSAGPAKVVKEVRMHPTKEEARKNWANRQETPPKADERKNALSSSSAANALELRPHFKNAWNYNVAAPVRKGLGAPQVRPRAAPVDPILEEKVVGVCAGSEDERHRPKGSGENALKRVGAAAPVKETMAAHHSKTVLTAKSASMPSTNLKPNVPMRHQAVPPPASSKASLSKLAVPSKIFVADKVIRSKEAAEEGKAVKTEAPKHIVTAEPVRKPLATSSLKARSALQPASVGIASTKSHVPVVSRGFRPAAPSKLADLKKAVTVTETVLASKTSDGEKFQKTDVVVNDIGLSPIEIVDGSQQSSPLSYVTSAGGNEATEPEEASSEDYRAETENAEALKTPVKVETGFKGSNVEVKVITPEQNSEASKRPDESASSSVVPETQGSTTSPSSHLEAMRFLTLQILAASALPWKKSGFSNGAVIQVTPAIQLVPNNVVSLKVTVPEVTADNAEPVLPQASSAVVVESANSEAEAEAKSEATVVSVGINAIESRHPLHQQGMLPSMTWLKLHSDSGAWVLGDFGGLTSDKERKFRNCPDFRVKNPPAINKRNKSTSTSTSTANKKTVIRPSLQVSVATQISLPATATSGAQTAAPPSTSVQTETVTCNSTGCQVSASITSIDCQTDSLTSRSVEIQTSPKYFKNDPRILVKLKSLQENETNLKSQIQAQSRELEKIQIENQRLVAELASVNEIKKETERLIVDLSSAESGHPSSINDVGMGISNCETVALDGLPYIKSWKRATARPHPFDSSHQSAPIFPGAVRGAGNQDVVGVSEPSSGMEGILESLPGLSIVPTSVTEATKSVQDPVTPRANSAMEGVIEIPASVAVAPKPKLDVSSHYVTPALSPKQDTPMDRQAAQAAESLQAFPGAVMQFPPPPPFWSPAPSTLDAKLVPLPGQSWGSSPQNISGDHGGSPAPLLASSIAQAVARRGPKVRTMGGERSGMVSCGVSTPGQSSTWSPCVDEEDEVGLDQEVAVAAQDDISLRVFATCRRKKRAISTPAEVPRLCWRVLSPRKGN
ncbi:hypothetical protein BC829DRAFT_434283 [Chytridium lagenaria]|nr:hypothetical protein BC829DRAFT_434283 [Chytridium lagenaria]